MKIHDFMQSHIDNEAYNNNNNCNNDSVMSYETIKSTIHPTNFVAYQIPIILLFQTYNTPLMYMHKRKFNRNSMPYTYEHTPLRHIVLSKHQ